MILNENMNAEWGGPPRCAATANPVDTVDSRWESVIRRTSSCAPALSSVRESRADPRKAALVLAAAATLTVALALLVRGLR